MRIRLLHSYSGVLTNEVRMAEGEHEVTPELGNYLVDNGHAVYAEEPQILEATASSDTWIDVTPVSEAEPVTEDTSATPDSNVSSTPKRKR